MAQPLKSNSAAAQPPAWTRLLALVMGPVYLFCWCVSLSVATDTSLGLTALFVGLGSAAIMGVLIVFGLKALEAKESFWRFNLSSIMLIMAPLGVYLVALRAALSKARLNEFEIWHWLLLVFFACGMMALSTLILLAYADALAWFAVKLMRLIKRASQPRVGDALSVSSPSNSNSRGEDTPSSP